MNASPDFERREALNDNEIHTELLTRRDHARTQTQHADTKAAVLAGAVVPAIAAAVAAGAFIGLPPIAAIIGWAAAALGLAVVFELGAALWPRDRESDQTETDGVALVDELERTGPVMHRVNLAREVIAIEDIVATKHQWLRSAIRTTAAAVVMAANTVVLSLITG
jgi:hypothetical protein